MKKGKIVVFLVAVGLIFSSYYIVQAVTSEPGTSEDPIATKSYVDKQLGQIQFKVLELKKDQTIVCKEGTELIVRSGDANAVSGSNGDGISDVSSDSFKDYYNGQTVPKNRLIVASRSDGRGIKATSDKVYILIKGSYEVK